jgi:hypothetical protein
VAWQSVSSTTVSTPIVPNMKQQRKLQQWLQSALVGLALAGSTSLTLAQGDYIISTFDDEDGVINAVSGWHPDATKKPATNWWDSTQNAPGGAPGSGSMYVRCYWDTTVGNNWQEVQIVRNAGFPWNGGNYVPLSPYINFECDIKVDVANSVLATNQSGAPVSYLQFQPIIQQWGWTPLASVTIPNTNGWVHISVPLGSATTMASAVLDFHWAWWNVPAGPISYWIDNVMLTAPPAPPPTMDLKKTTSGLQFMTAGSGSGGRQSISPLDPNYSWVDASGPVTFKLTIKEYPGSAYPNFQTHIFLAPEASIPYGPGDSSVDWNATNLVFIQIQNLTNGHGQASFMYKTNSGSSWGGQVFGSNTLGIVQGASPVGAWTLTFENNTNVTLTAPDNTSTNFIMPPDAAAQFAGPLYVWFGAQANAANNVGQTLIVDRIQITGGVSPEIDDSFPGPGLDTTNTWRKAAADAAGIQVASPGTAYWLSWTTPDKGFEPEWSPSLSPGAVWLDPGLTPVLAGSKRLATVPASLSTSNAFLRLVKRSFTKLQVLMPGETAAPGTPTGKTGTPTAQQVNVPFDVIVNAVDDSWHVVTSVSDTINITSSDGSATLPADAALVGGTGPFTVTFNAAGTWTVTATDVANSSLTGTGAATTVN